MPDLASLAIIALAIGLGAFGGCYVAFRAILHILDRWM